MENLYHTEAIEKVFTGDVKHEAGYCEIPTSLFIARMDAEVLKLPNAAFYIKTGDTYKILKAAKDSCSALTLSMYGSIWVQVEDFYEIQNFAETMLRKAATDTSVNPQRRAESLQKTALKVVENLFDEPSPENISRSVKVVGSFVYVIMKEPKSYLLLSQLSGHDPYTLRHSVGTSIHCIILAKKSGMTDEKELTEIGLAGLLHDIGKVKVKREIINKTGPLDELEWEEMRQHAQAGYDIVKDNPMISERIKKAIWEHHEDRNGTGYPQRKKLADTDLFSRIVSVCDIFNALTTDRTYSKAKTPLEAFQLMKEKLSYKYDEALFQELVKIYGGAV
jgi:HD-GYP domain-containing protein (c-di-GMP phosphodiesterase class II)